MTHPHTRRKSRSHHSAQSHSRSIASHSESFQAAAPATSSRINKTWHELKSSRGSDVVCSSLMSLIERDAPLQSHSGLLLMYGPFQTELSPEGGQGVATWLQDCVRKHGLPSLVRYDYRRRAQVFRRDQFQSWLEPFLAKMSG